MALLLYACASYRVSVDYDPNVEFGKLRTYDCKPGTETKAGDPVVDTDTLMQQRITQAIDRELARRGYRRKRSKPDFLVSFFFTRERRIEASSYFYPYPYYGGVLGGPYYGGYWGGWGYPGYYGGGYLRDFDEGLLVIDVRAPATDALIWRGMIRDYIRFEEDPGERERRIAESISAALARFPPQ